MSSTTESTQTSEPPGWAKPLFTQSAKDAQKLYNSGAGGNVYSGSTVADLSGTTMGGINALNKAGSNTNTAQTRPLFQGIGAASVSPSHSEQNLGDMANGTYLKNGNPYFNEALQGQLNDTAAQVQSQFSGAGRYGSGANTGALTSQLGNIRSNAMYNQFNQDTQNMMAANGLMDTQRNAGLDRALSATNSMSAQDQNQFQNGLAGAGAQLQAGGILDAQAQKQLSDKVSQWYAQDNQDWNRLGMLQSAAAGAAGNYGTQTGQSSSSNPMAAVGAATKFMGK